MQTSNLTGTDWFITQTRNRATSALLHRVPHSNAMNMQTNISESPFLLLILHEYTKSVSVRTLAARYQLSNLIVWRPFQEVFSAWQGCLTNKAKVVWPQASLSYDLLDGQNDWQDLDFSSIWIVWPYFLHWRGSSYGSPLILSNNFDGHFITLLKVYTRGCRFNYMLVQMYIGCNKKGYPVLERVWEDEYKHSYAIYLLYK